MRIRQTIVMVACVLGCFDGAPVHATKPSYDRHYVMVDELVATARKSLSPATADEIRKAFDGKERAFFAGKDPSTFSEEQFVGKDGWGRLCDVLQREEILDKSKDCDLNGLLRQPGLYERVRNRHGSKTEPASLRTLRQTYEGRQSEMDQIDSSQVQPPTHGVVSDSKGKATCTLALTELNRAVLATYYPKECPLARRTREDLVQVDIAFLEDFITPYFQRNELTKVKQFLQAVNQKTIVHTWRLGSGQGCYRVQYSIEEKSVQTPPGEARVHLTWTRKPGCPGLN
jgi:hypothetical protein